MQIRPQNTEVPETGEFIYREPAVPIVDDDEDDGIIGILYGPDGEELSVLYRPFGFGRRNN